MRSPCLRVGGFFKHEDDEASGVAVRAVLKGSLVAALPVAKVGGAPAAIGMLKAEKVGDQVASLIAGEERWIGARGPQRDDFVEEWLGGVVA